ncbi:MAG: PAS domain S-box protein [Verrucomicrobiota bacterium]
MKDYRKMSRAGLLAWIEKLKSKQATRTKVQQARSQTRQKQAASALRDSGEQLRAILESAVEGIITIDEHGIIESFNQAAERIFGYKAREVVGKNVSLLMPPPHREAHDSYIANYLRTGHAKIIGIGRETVGQRKGGAIFPMDLSVSEVRLADRRIFTGFARDITERKRLEREILEISDREQRRIGHDLHDGLCQHLAGIELMSQVLAQKLTPQSKDAAKRASDIAKNVRAAIGQTRSLARGLSPVTLESEGLTSALHELAVNTEKLFNVKCHFDGDSPVSVHNHAMATHLFRLAQEAVSNAIKHGKARRISIHLTADPGRIHLAVNDNGKGFPAEIPTSKGMGLRIMRLRTGMIGGTLTIERNAGGGASVICSAPNNPTSPSN